MGIFDSSLGAFFVGTFLAVWLSGVVMTQAFAYFTTFGSSDRKVYIYLIAVLLLIDVVHTIITVHTVYYWGVTYWGVLESLVRVPWSFAIEPAFTAVVAFIAQVFYAYRVYVVSSRKPFVPAAILLCSAIGFGFGVGGTAEIFVLHREVARFQEWNWGVTTWLIASSVADLLITGSLVYYLKGAQGDYQKTNALVQRILRNTIETNGLTCVVALIDAILFLAYPAASWHVIMQCVLVKLYANSVLVSLNSRQKINDHLNPPSSQSMFSKTGGDDFGGSQVYGGKAGHGQQIVPIHVTMDETIHTDLADEKDIGYANAVSPAQHDSNEVELDTIRGREKHPFSA